MSVSFVRIDDRMIHGQTVTRWSLEYPCDGLIAVNDAAASNPVLKAAYKSASDKKVVLAELVEGDVPSPECSLREIVDVQFLI
jgi:mannose/fructose/N-acetylgalactosamine-specific phosphotransferase system component IIB